MQERNFAKARQYFEGALVADPTHSAAYHAWGMMERQVGDWERARTLFLEGIQKCALSSSCFMLWRACSLAMHHLCGLAVRRAALCSGGGVQQRR